MLLTTPDVRGTTLPGRDLELQLLRAFGPTPAIFCEKPVSTDRVAEAKLVAASLAVSENRVAVGYMLRYLKVVQKTMQIIRKNKLTVMSVGARYVCAYQRIRKFDWWDKEKQCGPIVEQATHFCDLCRYLGGEVIMQSVRATSLEHYEQAGSLNDMAIDESEILERNRIPRVTAAFWKYTSGAIGTLTHIIALHGIKYENEIDVTADGYQFRLVDLYGEPRLFVRFPTDEREQEFSYPNDDPFSNELSAVIDAADTSTLRNNSASRLNGIMDVGSAENGNKNWSGTPEVEDEQLGTNGILSSFEDAVKTYEFSWKIRDQSEESRAPHASWKE